MKYLIVLPLQGELDAFLAHGRRSGIVWTSSYIGRLPVYEASDLNLTVAKGGTGKAQFALQTQHLLDNGPMWDLVICAGAAGALVDEVAIGDAVIATVTVEHDYRNRFSERPLPRFVGDPAAVAALRQVQQAGAEYRVHFGPVASGDEDIIAGARRQELHADTGGLAAAWEGAGGARACAFSDVPFLEIRGMTDGADHQAAVAFEDNLALAVNHIADLVLTWISSERP
jgi:adenosylhomocysteine nucleosidase